MTKTRLAAFLALMLAAPVLGAQQQYGRDSNLWRWDGRVEAGRWMHVFNGNGSVDFTASEDNSVHVGAGKRTRDGREGGDIPYEGVQAGGNGTNCAIWKGKRR